MWHLWTIYQAICVRLWSFWFRHFAGKIYLTFLWFLSAQKLKFHLKLFKKRRCTMEKLFVGIWTCNPQLSSNRFSKNFSNVIRPSSNIQKKVFQCTEHPVALKNSNKNVHIQKNLKFNCTIFITRILTTVFAAHFLLYFMQYKIQKNTQKKTNKIS